MNEHGFVRSVHRQLSPDVFVWKINDKYAGGVPDAFYAGPARCLFIEYKYVKLPKRDTTLVKTSLSEQQKLWLQENISGFKEAKNVNHFYQYINNELEER